MATVLSWCFWCSTVVTQLGGGEGYTGLIGGISGTHSSMHHEETKIEAKCKREFGFRTATAIGVTDFDCYSIPPMLALIQRK